MKAVVINRYGSSQVLELAQVKGPESGDEQVLVEVYASSVNPLDWKIRKGMLRWISPKKFPFIPGGDIAGRVVQVGKNVQFFRLGDEVYGKLDTFKGGGYAEFVAASHRCIALKPQTLTFEQAATVPLAAMTALQALRNLGHISSGSRVVINGCSGGVGCFALQIARYLKAHVTGICSQRNIDLSHDLGAHKVIDYNRGGFEDIEGEVDVFFDVVANASFAKVKPMLSPGGIYITTLPGITALLFAPLLNSLRKQKHKSIMVKDSRKDLEFLAQLIDDGEIRTVIDKEFTLEEIQNAHQYSETGRVVGKILLKIKD